VKLGWKSHLTIFGIETLTYWEGRGQKRKEREGEVWRVEIMSSIKHEFYHLFVKVALLALLASATAFPIRICK